MHNDELARMVECTGYSILRFASRKVKRIQHVERSGKPFSERVVFERFRLNGSYSDNLRQLPRFLPRLWRDVDPIQLLHL
jgi:hypothetical protein